MSNSDWVGEFPAGGFLLVEEVQTIDESLTALRDFVDVMDSELEELIERKRIVAAAETPASVPADLAASIQQASEDALARHVSYATVLTIALTLERELVRFCNMIGEELAVRLRLSDIRGDLLGRSHTFLFDVAEWKGRPPTALWEHLRDVMELRNHIIHAGGELAEGTEAEKWRQFGRRRGGVSVEGPDHSKWRQIAVGPEFRRAAVEALRKFFWYLCQPLWEEWPEVPQDRWVSRYSLRRYSLGDGGAT